MIRIERTAQLDIVERLDRIVFPSDDPADIERGRWWLAWDGDVPVAFAGARRLTRENAVILERCGVVLAARGQGLQLRLIRARLRWSGELGADATLTYTLPQNVASSNNLIRAGFLLYAPEWPWVGSSVLYWKRSL